MRYLLLGLLLVIAGCRFEMSATSKKSTTTPAFEEVTGPNGYFTCYFFERDGNKFCVLKSASGAVPSIIQIFDDEKPKPKAEIE